MVSFKSIKALWAIILVSSFATTESRAGLTEDAGASSSSATQGRLRTALPQTLVVGEPCNRGISSDLELMSQGYERVLHAIVGNTVMQNPQLVHEDMDLCQKFRDSKGSEGVRKCLEALVDKECRYFALSGMLADVINARSGNSLPQSTHLVSSREFLDDDPVRSPLSAVFLKRVSAVGRTPEGVFHEGDHILQCIQKSHGLLLPGGTLLMELELETVFTARGGPEYSNPFVGVIDIDSRHDFSAAVKAYLKSRSIFSDSESLEDTIFMRAVKHYGQTIVRRVTELVDRYNGLFNRPLLSIDVGLERPVAGFASFLFGYSTLELVNLAHDEDCGFPMHRFVGEGETSESDEGFEMNPALGAILQTYAAFSQEESMLTFLRKTGFSDAVLRWVEPTELEAGGFFIEATKDFEHTPDEAGASRAEADAEEND